MRFFLAICILLSFCLHSQAAVRVAFFEARDRLGRLVQLEPNGRFYHVAISYRYGWVQSAPKVGVQQLNDIRPLVKLFGEPAVVLRNENLPAIGWQKVKPYLRLPFDYQFRWDDPRSTYCSKLVANLLDIDPLPMQFDSPYWRRSRTSYKAGLGLSPDDLFRILQAKGFTAEEPLRKSSIPACEQLLIK